MARSPPILVGAIPADSRHGRTDARCSTGEPIHVADLQAEVEEFPEGSMFARGSSATARC